MRVGLLVVVLVLWGCGGSTGPSYPTLSGTYSANFVGTVTPSGYASQSLASTTGSMTLSNASSSGAFSGSYVQGGAAGTIAGTEHTDGGIDISQFGNPNETPLDALEVLQQALPGCDFAQAAGVPMSGAISGTTLNLSGGLILPCTWIVGGQNEVLSTTIALSISGTRG
jgi:hypothetical protein